MVDDLDSIDDILLEPKETTGQVAGRFRPKARAKATKVTVGPSKTSGVVEPLPPVVEPQCSDSGVNQQEGSILSCSVLGSCTTAPDHNVVQESFDQSLIIDSGPLTCIGDNKEVLRPHQPSSREDADVLFDMDSIDDLINPVSTTASAVGIFKPKTNTQPKSKKTAMPPSVSGVVESTDASTVSSSISDLDAISSELYRAHAPQQQNKEAVIHIDASQDVLQFSEIDTKLHLDPDKSEEILEFCSTEFQEDTIFHISETLVEPVRKFQPKQRQKEGKGKSVSFVLPEACEVVAPVETGLERRDSNGLDLPIQTMVSDENFDDDLQPSTTIADGSGEFCQNSGEQIFFSERQQFDESEDVGNEVQSQNVGDLTQKKLERPRSGNLGDVRASKPSDNDLDIGDSNISQMDEDLSDASDDEYKTEDTTKRKRVPGESRKKKNENEKPTQKLKRSFKKSDRPLEGLPKEKLFHRVRQKRRLADKVLLHTPESEINRRQIAIKDLILLQEAKERIWNKDAEALGKSSSNQSSSTSSLPRKRNIDDFDFFGDAEENHDNEETNPNIQKSAKKLNYHSYMNRSKSVKWSKSETELFYQAMRQFGTDFAMIQKLFPNRTRHQVKLKYKYEERNNPMQLDDVFRRRPKDHSHFEKIIQLLQIQAEQDPQKGAFENQETTASQDNSYENEEMIDGDNKGEESYGWADQSHSPIHSNIRNHGAQSPTEADDFEGLFDWDLEDMEEDIFNPN